MRLRGDHKKGEASHRYAVGDEDAIEIAVEDDREGDP